MNKKINFFKKMFQVASDIHSEFLPECNQGKMFRFMQSIITPFAPYLILAGDIGQSHRKNFEYLLQWCSEHFVHTFVVAGNHEYYASQNLIYKGENSMECVEQRTRKLFSKFTNVHFLQKERFDFIHTYDDGREIKYTILGCTFWYHIPDDYLYQIRLWLNDFLHIYKRTYAPLNPQHVKKLHEDHKTWLFNEIEEWYRENSDTQNGVPEMENSEMNKLIVITHHPATKVMDTGTLPCGYSTEYYHAMGAYIHAWVSGHTHECKRIQNSEKPLLISNCVGYNEQKTGFEKNCIF